MPRNPRGEAHVLPFFWNPIVRWLSMKEQPNIAWYSQTEMKLLKGLACSHFTGEVSGAKQLRNSLRVLISPYELVRPKLGKFGNRTGWGFGVGHASFTQMMKTRQAEPWKLRLKRITAVYSPCCFPRREVLTDAYTNDFRHFLTVGQPAVACGVNYFTAATDVFLLRSVSLRRNSLMIVLRRIELRTRLCCYLRRGRYVSTSVS